MKPNRDEKKQIPKKFIDLKFQKTEVSNLFKNVKQDKEWQNLEVKREKRSPFLKLNWGS